VKGDINPSDKELHLDSSRLAAYPLKVGDADELFVLLNDAALHEFVGGSPIGSVEDMRTRFTTLEERKSPARSELWLNWVLRRKQDGRAVGTLQTTVREMEGQMAWVIATRYQGQGYAKEAARMLARWLLTHLKLTVLVAHVHPDHHASARVAAAAGLSRTEQIVEGEVVWRLDRRNHSMKTPTENS